VYSSHVQKYIDEIKQGDTIIIVAHGSEEAIFHRYDHTNSVENHQYLLKSNELDVLNDNKIIAVSCGCARKLGPESVSQGKCKVFLGFMNSIHFDKKNGKHVSKYYENYVKTIYKGVFLEIIERAIIENWTFQKLGNVLSWELRKSVTEMSKKELEVSGTHAYFGRGIDQAILAINDVAANIKIFGEASITVR
ncbi:hypothetical protein FMI95_002182, partial [Enterococcus faecalis]|nr:hypothetical protein [Enterococcus faecalis]